jgi:hypothetical protein
METETALTVSGRTPLRRSEKAHTSIASQPLAGSRPPRLSVPRATGTL